LKNEKKTDEMAEIMEHLQQYVPSKRTTETFVMSGSEPITLQMDHFQHILFGGDQLTVARARGAQGILSNSHTGSDRLEGLVPVVEDWHAKVTFMKLLWTRLYKTNSSMDGGDSLPATKSNKPEKCGFGPIR